MAQYKTFLEWIGGTEAITNCIVMKFPVGLFGMPITFNDFTEYKRFFILKHEIKLKKDIELDISIFSPINQMTAISDLSPYLNISQKHFQSLISYISDMYNMKTVELPLKYENKLYLTFGDDT